MRTNKRNPVAKELRESGLYRQQRLEKTKKALAKKAARRKYKGKLDE